MEKEKEEGGTKEKVNEEGEMEVGKENEEEVEKVGTEEKNEEGKMEKVGKEKEEEREGDRRRRKIKRSRSLEQRKKITREMENLKIKAVGKE